MKASIFRPLLLASLAFTPGLGDEQLLAPGCASDCAMQLSGTLDAADLTTICFDNIRQNAILRCLSTSCHTDSYGIALVSILSTCLDLGANLQTIYPVDIQHHHLYSRQLVPMAPGPVLYGPAASGMDQEAALSLQQEFMLSIECSAGPDGVLTISLPDPTSPLPEPSITDPDSRQADSAVPPCPPDPSTNPDGAGGNQDRVIHPYPGDGINPAAPDPAQTSNSGTSAFPKEPTVVCPVNTAPDPASPSPTLAPASGPDSSTTPSSGSDSPIGTASYDPGQIPVADPNSPVTPCPESTAAGDPVPSPVIATTEAVPGPLDSTGQPCQVPTDNSGSVSSVPDPITQNPLPESTWATSAGISVPTELPASDPANSITPVPTTIPTDAASSASGNVDCNADPSGGASSTGPCITDSLPLPISEVAVPGQPSQSTDASSPSTTSESSSSNPEAPGAPSNAVPSDPAASASSLPDTTFVEPLPSEPTSGGSADDSGAPGTTDGSDDTGPSNQPAPPSEVTLWPLPAGASTAAPAPAPAPTIETSITVVTDPTSMMETTITFIKATPPSGWVPYSSTATSATVTGPLEVTLWPPMGETTLAPADASAPEGMMVVTIIAPEGQSGTQTAVFTVPSMDAAITALPDLVEIPGSGGANKRELNPRQAGEGGSSTTSIFRMSSNGTTRPDIVAVMGNAHSNTISLALMCTCAMLALALTRDTL